MTTKKAPWMDFGLGGLSTSMACLVSHPIEVVKVRQQLQGELTRVDRANRIFRANPFQALRLVFKHEGVSGLYSGLRAGMLYQFCMNGLRLGSFEVLMHYGSTRFGTHSDGQSKVNLFVQRVLCGLVSGALSSVVTSPIMLVKTRMQSQASASIAVGRQHSYASMAQGFRSLYAEGGCTVRGLYRGASASALRVSLGGATQLTTYTTAKDVLSSHARVPGRVRAQFERTPVLLHLCASWFAGVAVIGLMNPADLVVTRIYNSSAGMYNGIADCFLKIVRAEGFLGLYKGAVSNWLRVGPHTTLTFVLFEQFKRLFHSVEASKYK
jgi:solute carrier family 25, member 34/35